MCIQTEKEKWYLRLSHHFAAKYLKQNERSSPENGIDVAVYISTNGKSKAISHFRKWKYLMTFHWTSDLSATDQTNSAILPQALYNYLYTYNIRNVYILIYIFTYLRTFDIYIEIYIHREKYWMKYRRQLLL